MANPVSIKGSTATVNGSASLGGASLLYAQLTFASAPNPYQWFMSRWLYLRGGTYVIKVAAADKATISINGGDAMTVVSGVLTTISATLPTGASRFDISVSHSSNNSPAYIGFAMFKDGETIAEYVTSPDGWIGDLEEKPDPGDKPQITMNINLPVFPLEPNWSDAVVETFEFLTNIMTSETGAEQRRKVRMFPRRYIQAKFTEWDREARITDNALAGLGQNNLLVPLWFDKQGLGEPIKAGEYDIYGDFVDRIDYSAGRLLLLKNPNNYLDSEVIIIKEVYDHHIVSEREIKKDWGAGTIVYPLVRARISEIDSPSHQTSTVIETSVKFDIIDQLKINGEWHYTEDNAATGQKVLVGIQNNWNDAVTIDIARNVTIQDNSVGVPVSVDVGNNAIATQRLSMMVNGKKEYRNLIEMFYAMGGQFSLFQFPTRLHDIKLARDIAHHEGFLVCRPTGYMEFGVSNQHIRQWLMISLYSGRKIFGRVISVKRDDDYEYLVLEQAVGDIMLKDIHMVCWCPISRLGSDSIELQHHTDIEGASEVVLAIDSFYNRRNLP